MRIRTIIVFIAVVCFTRMLPCACAVEEDRILAAWEEEGRIYAQIRCGTEDASIVYIGFTESGKYAGLKILPAVPGKEQTYETALITGAERFRVLLLTGDFRPLAEAVDIGEKPGTPRTGPDTLTIDGTVYALGMTEEQLLESAGEPEEQLPSTAGYRWLVYGTQTYRDFFMAGVYQGQVVALCSGGAAFIWESVQAGSVGAVDTSGYATLYTDKNDGGILHAILLTDRSALPKTYDNSQDALYGESRVIFHMTNAFRIYHELSAFQWSDAAAEAARLHSQDMADQNYFSHESLDGRQFTARMEAQGISWWSVGENISTGRRSGVAAYDGWVNSAGHRSNMLDSFRCLGVGSGYSSSSTYGYYATQDFFS